MKFIKRFRVAITLSSIACLILCTAGFKACPKSEKDSAVAFARDLNGAFIAAGPLVAQKSAELGRQWVIATGLTAQVIDAIATSDSTQVARLIQDILPVFNEVVRAFSNDPNVLLALALGQIALNFFVNHYVTKSNKARMAVSPATLKAIDEFKAQRQFGCELRPERCH